MYRVHFKSGIRFPASDFLEAVLDYYQLHITQISPNGFHKVICFMLLCSALIIPHSITLFRHLYITLFNGDWVSFSLCRGLVELSDGLPTSVKWWKEEFFFVDVSAFLGPMVYGATTNRGSDALPDLSAEEQ